MQHLNRVLRIDIELCPHRGGPTAHHRLDRDPLTPSTSSSPTSPPCTTVHHTGSPPTCQCVKGTRAPHFPKGRQSRTNTLTANPKTKTKTKTKAQCHFTDPDSAIMKTSAEGFQQCYNAQVAVDGEHQLIVATELTSNASDQSAMVGLLDEVKDTFDEQPGRVLAESACNRFWQCKGACSPVRHGQNHSARAFCRTPRTLSSALCAIAHLRCPGAPAHPRIESGPSIRLFVLNYLSAAPAVLRARLPDFAVHPER